MANTGSESSQPEKQQPPNEKFIVRQTLDPDSPPSAETLERLRRVAGMPDEEIRTDLIPELPPEAWKHAVKNPYARILSEQSARKAS